MNLSEAFMLFWIRTFDIRGKTDLREFWLGVLSNAMIMIFLGVLLILSLTCFVNTINPFSITMITIFAMFCVIELVPSITLIIRRMHDIGKSGYLVLVLIIPIIGFIWYLYLVTRPTNFYKPKREQIIY